MEVVIADAANPIPANRAAVSAGALSTRIANAVVHVGAGGATAANVPTGAGNTVVSANAGRLCRVLVTTAGTGTGSVLIYDNATTNAGTVIGIIPATIAIGTYYTFDMPAANGITAVNVLNGPVLTISFD